MRKKKTSPESLSFEQAYRDNILEIQKKYKNIFPFLNEKQKRLLVANDVLFLKIQVTTASTASGLNRNTINKGLKELKSGDIVETKIRRQGGGRKNLLEKNPTLVKEIESLIEPFTKGDPMSPLRWTSKSLRNISDSLKEKGINASYKTVGEILKSLKYSLKGNSKQYESKKNPDRNEQFLNINEQVKRFLKSGNPVISVDTKKKENVGLYANNGKEWSPKGKPQEVNVHDFPNPEKPKAVPYGIYDLEDNTGYVNVGISHDTAEFSVESIRQWWKNAGNQKYKKAKELLICADAGGSNGYRVRLWKYELQKLANETGLKITVCHFPPGTSKWNKIEHKLFSFISKNWRGVPLISHKVVINLIASTKTKSGLTVEARLDKNTYPKKIKVTDKEFARINLQPHSFHGDWNYSIDKNEEQ